MADNQPAFQIVRAGAEHVTQLAPLFDAYRRFYQFPADLAGVRAYLSERLSRGEAVVFLALESGLPVRPACRTGRQAGAAAAPSAAGLGFTLLYPSFSSVSMKRLWILNDLFVAPEARRRGVARALLEAARQHAVATGAKGLALETGADNHSAQRLYEQLGWKRESGVYHYSLTL